ncbi:MAG: Mbeg1-like protein [Nitrospirales bacterium]
MGEEPFDSRTTQYRHQNAMLLAQAALLAYQTPDVIQPVVAQWGLDQFVFVDRGETQAYLAGNEDMIVLAFRGTEPDNLKDWMTDAKIKRVKGPYGRVHRGFLKGLRTVLPEIRAVLEEWQVHAQSLWLTGHSLGAALATLAVATFGEEAKPVHGLYTFGQPRVGGKSFARNFDLEFQSRTFRFVNNNDVVTRVPPRELGYRHVGNVLVFDTFGKLQTDLHFWNHFLDRVKGRIEDLGKPGTDGVKDHHMANYLKQLDRKENRKIVVV